MNRRGRIVVRCESGGRGSAEYDEKAEQSFARPLNSICARSKNLRIRVRIELPLVVEGNKVSPAASEISMADSVGSGPGLELELLKHPPFLPTTSSIHFSNEHFSCHHLPHPVEATVPASPRDPHVASSNSVGEYWNTSNLCY